MSQLLCVQYFCNISTLVALSNTSQTFNKFRSTRMYSIQYGVASVYDSTIQYGNEQYRRVKREYFGSLVFVLSAFELKK